MKKSVLLSSGIALGLILSMSLQVFAAPAIEKIQAFVNNQFKFEFNGKLAELPDEYEVIVYKDRSYVPVRFITENLGATVDWNDTEKLISINSPDVVAPKPTDSAIDNYNYKALPQTRDSLGYRTSVLSYFRDGQGMGDRLYISIENKGDEPIRIDQMATKVVANGTTYLMKASDAVDFDTRWFNDLNKDEYVEGYLRLPRELKDEKNLHVEITIHTKGNQGMKSNTLEFNIAL